MEASEWFARFFVSEVKKCSNKWAGGVAGSSELSYAHNPYAAKGGTGDDAWEAVYLQ